MHPIVLALLFGCGIAFAIGMIFNAPASLGYGCLFAAAWYMAIGGIAIVVAAGGGTPAGPLMWFALYGVLAAPIVFAFSLIGTAVGMISRLISRGIERRSYD